MTPSFFLNLGMLSIPVKASPAARDAESGLVNLHEPCAQRGVEATLRMEKRCRACGEIVEAPVKGYKVDKGKYVLIAPEELKALNAEASRAMTIECFVPAAGIDAIHYGRSDYLVPVDPATARPFAVLREAMRDAEVVALARYVGTGRDKLGLLRVAGQALMLHETFFQAEIRVAPAVSDAVVTKEERAFAAQLITAYSTPSLDLSGFGDGYLDRVRQMIESRAATALSTPVAASSQVVDLMEALKVSLEQRKGLAKVAEPQAPAPAEAKRATSKKRRPA